ncbi:uncharacterized protein LOC122080930 [Macadamia integrifolia]|uniref:uncharacterized protein LOC122080930 n=1 Tax=Macadamia integrifolia TaxID=60698 RepID=UPI001C4F72DE|nr:uncharacterized protein LOC122080930 [Macadamia integrifolia]
MVFREIYNAEEALRSISMATAPVKSQPLHNFSLPFLKWGKNQMNNYRCRKLVDPSRDSPPPDHRSSPSEAESETAAASSYKKDSEAENRKYPIGSRSSKNRFGFSSSAASTTEKLLKNTAASEADAVGLEESKGKLFIRFSRSSKEEPASKNKGAAVAADCGGEVGGEVEESALKPWNLRPRRAVFKAPIEIGGPSKNGDSLDDLPPMPQPEHLPKSLRLRGFAEVQNVEKKEKRQFSISLSRGEIEEDIFALTGSKPSRRPKKRPKNVQKQVDNVFPGMWLSEITADSYKVPDAPTKR